jgi:hypothetical protein
MPAKRRSPARVRVPGMTFEGRFRSSLFCESDIPKLATAAKLPAPSANHRHLAFDLTGAFVAAHAAAYNACNHPPTAELRDGYTGAAAAGCEFLLALGIKMDPAKLVSLSNSAILNNSALLRELVKAPPDSLLHREVVDAFEPQYRMRITERRRMAAQRQIVESARIVAFAIVATEAARIALPKPTRRGPSKKVFAPVLLSELVKIYHEMFGCWPTVKRIEGDNRGGPALKWLRDVLTLARDRFPSAEYETIVLGNSLTGSAPGELLAGIETLVDNSIETLGSKFEKAIACMKTRYPTFL